VYYNDVRLKRVRDDV